MVETTEDKVSQLCADCGMCCNGILFSWAKVTEDDIPLLAPYQASVKTAPDGDLHLVLPCKHLDCTSCTIYDHRPAICRSYFCLLAKRVQEGDITLGEAKGHVARLRSSADWLIENSTESETGDKVSFNLRDTLSSFHRRTLRKVSKGIFYQRDWVYFQKAYQHLKFVYKYFDKTRLLKKYVELELSFPDVKVVAKGNKAIIKSIKKPSQPK